MTRSASSPLLGVAVVLAVYAGKSDAQATARASASTPTAQSSTTPDITAADLRRRLSQFSDDSMLGREAATIGNVKATDYIARAARQLGLKPAGENGTYFQTVAMINRSIDTTSTMIVERQSCSLRPGLVSARLAGRPVPRSSERVGERCRPPCTADASATRR